MLEYFKASDERWEKRQEERERLAKEREDRLDAKADEREELAKEREKRLDAKADEREKRLEKSQTKMYNNLENIVKNLAKQMSGYTKTDSESIEDEINRKIQNYLVKKFSHCRVLKVDPLDWHVLWNNYRNNPNRHITEFDGLFIVTDDDTYTLDKSSGVVSFSSPGVNVTNKNIYQFVVVESKHQLSTDKVTKKVDQMRRFQTYIEESLSSEDAQFTDDFKQNVKKFKLQLFIDTPIHLVLASPRINDSCITYIKEQSQSWMKENIYVSYMKPSGNRYSIAFADEDFMERTNVNTKKLTIGGKKRGRKKIRKSNI